MTTTWTKVRRLTNSGAPAPNFFVIGPARCATESLYSYLKQHPQIHMSSIKETNYFVFYGERFAFDGPGDREALADCCIPDLEEYLSLFRGATGEIAVGEASPWYIYRPEVPERIQCDLPDAKFIAMLRNPIDRAFSAFGMLRLSNREPVTDFLEAFQLEQQRIKANWEPLWHYQSMGMYYEQIKRYYDRFDASQIKVCIYDDFNAQPAPLLRDMFRFLGVDERFTPDVSVRLNQSYVPKNAKMHAVLAGASSLKGVIRPLLPCSLRQRMKTPVVNFAVGKAELNIDTRRQLVEVFREDVSRLQDLLCRDLSHWLR